MTRPSQPLLFATTDLPEVASPVGEYSPEARHMAMLKTIEAVRFDLTRLAAYEASLQAEGLGFEPNHGREFLDFCLWQMGGRSQ
jgi:hypothetical protein